MHGASPLEASFARREEDVAMKPERSKPGRRPTVLAPPFLTILAAFAGLGLSGSTVMAQRNDQKSKAPERTFENFDRNNFDRSTDIDNKWFPLTPGTRYVYKGYTQKGKKRVPHRVVVIVTDLVKVIDGVPAIVVWETDYKDGKLAESELVFFAQD